MEEIQAKGQSSTPEPVIRICTDFGEVSSNPANTEEHFQVRLTESKYCQLYFRGMYFTSATYPSYAAILYRLQFLRQETEPVKNVKKQCGAAARL